MFKVLIKPIVGDWEFVKRGFGTEAEAWQWVEDHNCPFVDYEVIEERRDSHED